MDCQTDFGFCIIKIIVLVKGEIMSKFCTNCGNEVNDDSRFCPFCGVSVESPQVEAAPAQEVSPYAPEPPKVYEKEMPETVTGDPTPIIMPDPVIDNVGPSIIPEPVQVAQPQPQPVNPQPVAPSNTSYANNVVIPVNNVPVQESAPKKGKAFNIVSMILGIISVLFCCGFWGGFLGLLISVPAVALGIVGLAKKAPLKGMAIAGIICGAIGILISICGGAFSCYAMDYYGVSDFEDLIDMIDELIYYGSF